MKVAKSGSRRRSRCSLREDQRVPQAPFGDARPRNASAYRRCHVEKGDNRAGVAGLPHAGTVRSLVAMSRRDDRGVCLRRPGFYIGMQDARHCKRQHASQPHEASSLLTNTRKLMERDTRHGRIHAASRVRYTITLGRFAAFCLALLCARADDSDRSPGLTARIGVDRQSGSWFCCCRKSLQSILPRRLAIHALPGSIHADTDHV